MTGDLTGHALRVFRMRTLAIQYPDPCGKPAIPNKENSPPCPGWGWGVGTNIDTDRRIRSGYFFNFFLLQLSKVIVDVSGSRTSRGNCDRSL